LSYGRVMKFSLRLNVTPLPPISQITWLQPLRPEQPQFWWSRWERPPPPVSTTPRQPGSRL